MRRLVVTCIVAAAVAISSISSAQEKMSMASSKGRTTVSGTLIDTKCYSMNRKNKGNDHITEMGEMKGCGTLCANLGIPVGVLTASNTVWVLVTPSKDLATSIGSMARVAGTPVYGGHSIRPDKIEVKDASGQWTAIKISMPMPMEK